MGVLQTGRPPARPSLPTSTPPRAASWLPTSPYLCRIKIQKLRAAHLYSDVTLAEKTGQVDRAPACGRLGLAWPVWLVSCFVLAHLS